MSDALNELFERDPLELTEENIETVVEGLRAQRKNFDLGIKPTKTAAAKKTTKTKAAKEAPPELTLEGLGLDDAPPEAKPDPKSLNLDDLGL